MNKFKIAKTVSTLTNPPIICIPLFLIICFVLSDGDIFKFISLEAISVVFASMLPMAIILFWAKKLGTDKDISNRSDRYTPLIVGIISYFIGCLTSLFFGLDNFLTVLLLCYSINTGVVLIITVKWKISVHTTGLSGPVAALILLLGPAGAVFGVIYPILIWSRVLLKKHTMAQAVTGGVQGFFLTVLEMYLVFTLFNMDASSLTPLIESIYYILAIIFTPVMLGILSYIEVTGKKMIFIIAEIIGLVIFSLFMPLNVLIIFILVTLTSIFISAYAGHEFIWFNLIFE